MQKFNAVKKNKKNILLCAATTNEIQGVIHYLKKKYPVEKIYQNFFKAASNKYTVYILIAGVGMVNTAFYLGKISNYTFDFAINAGIAGSFDNSIKLGQLVVVKEEIFSELGAEDGKLFLKLSELDLGNEKVVPKKLFIPRFFQSFQQVSGITVNTVHGNLQSIQKVRKLFHPQIETMEGAAFYFACNMNHWKCLQIRSISNYIEKRNKNKWNIPLAINQLNNTLIQYLQL